VVLAQTDVVRVELGTFGAVMRFALELEHASEEFYMGLHGSAPDSTLKPVLEKILARCPIRVSTLERIRRENVTEMILEPIRGIDSDSFPTAITLPSSADSNDLRSAAKSWEAKRKSFFESASHKIEFLLEAADAFERLADENEENLNKLE
jgi:hypothetical protein